MIGGVILCSCAMLLLGYTRPIAAIFTGYDNAAVRLAIHTSLLGPLLMHTLQNDRWTIALAVLAVYIIDFAINAGSSVLPTDMCKPSHSHSAGGRPCHTR